MGRVSASPVLIRSLDVQVHGDFLIAWAVDAAGQIWTGEVPIQLTELNGGANWQFKWRRLNGPSTAGAARER